MSILKTTDARRAGALGGIALLLRLVFVIAVERRPAFPTGGVVSQAAGERLADAGLLNDAFFYHRTADLLAHGDGFASNPGVPTAQWPPVFPSLLSLVYRVTGSEPLAGELLNALLGAATVVMLYVLARRLFGRTEATVAAGILAVFPGQILWTEVLLAETLYAFLLVGFFLLLAVLPQRLWSAAVLGGAIGVITLTRGEGLLLLVVVLAVWWRALPGRALLLRYAAVVLAAVVVIAPWTIRNAVTMDAFVPLSSNSTITLWSGHNPNAKGSQNYAPRSLLARVKGRGKAREIGESKLLRREALDFAASHPGRELELIPLKLLSLQRGDSWALEWVNAGRPRERPLSRQITTPVAVVADSAYYGLLAATLLSVVLLGRELWRNRVLRGVLVLFAGALVLYGFVYYGNYRYRAPLEPLMILVVAPLLTRLWRLRGETL